MGNKKKIRREKIFELINVCLDLEKSLIKEFGEISSMDYKRVEKK